MINGLSEYWRRIFRRRSFYRDVFSGPSAKHVLADLKRFSKYGQPPLQLDDNGATNEMMTGIIIGRQEMLGRIFNHLHYDAEKIINLEEDQAPDEIGVNNE